jgi:MtN3 and saliva related transmembrane protein
MMGPVDPASPLIRTIGYIAGVITTLAFVPQVVRSWRTRSTRDLSLIWLVAFSSGVALWLTYGILLREPPIIAANATTFVLAAILLWIRLRPGRKPPRE